MPTRSAYVGVDTDGDVQTSDAVTAASLEHRQTAGDSSDVASIQAPSSVRVERSSVLSTGGGTAKGKDGRGRSGERAGYFHFETSSLGMLKKATGATVVQATGPGSMARKGKRHLCQATGPGDGGNISDIAAVHGATFGSGAFGADAGWQGVSSESPVTYPTAMRRRGTESSGRRDDFYATGAASGMEGLNTGAERQGVHSELPVTPRKAGHRRGKFPGVASNSADDRSSDDEPGPVELPQDVAHQDLPARAYHHARQLGWTAMTESEFRQIGTQVLCGIPDSVLTELVYGDLAERAVHDDVGGLFAADSEWLHRSTQDAPCVYVDLLADKDGGHIPRHRLASIVKVLWRYSMIPSHSDDEAINEAVAIDNAFKKTGIKTERKHIRNGRHRFFWKEGKNGQQGRRQPNHVRIVTEFCEALMARANNEGLPTLPLHYVGYAFNFAKRDGAHQRGEASSFLMQLVRSICEVLWPGEYSLKAYPVFFACNPGEAKVAEILLTLASHGLAATGMGMNIHPPGINNSSADLVGWRNEEASKFWNECEAFRKHMGFFKANMAQDLEIMQRSSSEEERQLNDKRLQEVKRLLEEKKALVKERLGPGLQRRCEQRLREAQAAVDSVVAKGIMGDETEEFLKAFEAYKAQNREMLSAEWMDIWGEKVTGGLKLD